MKAIEKKIPLLTYALCRVKGLNLLHEQLD